MAYVQTQFEQFHHAIRLGRFDENQTLRLPFGQIWRETPDCVKLWG